MSVSALLSAATPSWAGFSLVYNNPPNANGIDSAVVNFINASVSTLDVAIYDLDHPSIVSALINAKNRGVKVRVVTEADNWNSSMGSLVAAGIPVVKDTDGGGGSGLMHNKFAVRDGNALLTGSYNWTTKQATQDKNDLIVVTNAADLAHIFTLEFNKMFVSKEFGTQKSQTTLYSATVDGYAVQAYFSPKGNIAAKIKTQIYACDHNIIFNIFTFTDSAVATAIRNKAAAGRNVKGTFDRYQATFSSSQDDSLAAAGVPIRRDTYTGLLHDKMMAIDAYSSADPVGIIGSFNWTAAANNANDENVLIIHNPSVANSIYGNCNYVYYYKAN